MSEPFVGEIRMFGGNFAPAGWAFCAGQVIAISQNDVLFNLIGTTYGGDGVQTFNLPDLRGRVPVHQGSTAFGPYIIGQLSGAENVTLTANQLPIHTHTAMGSSATAVSNSPAGNTWAGNSFAQFGAGAGATVQMNASSVSSVGGSLPHDNMPPFLVVSFIISLFGIFPSRN